MNGSLRWVGMLCASLLAGSVAASHQPAGIRTQLQALDGVVAPALHQALNAFYALRGYRAAWHDGDGPTAAARSLLARLAVADREGLNPDDYLAQGPDGKPDAATVPADILLTLTYARYASHLRNGRYAARLLDPSWHIDDDLFNPFLTLNAALVTERTGVLLDALPPRHAAYVRLRDALGRYRAVAADGGWDPLPSGPALALGGRSARVAMLRQRLSIEGPRTTGDDPERFNTELGEVVRAFQRRHGLRDDGIVGRRTLTALNVDVTTRIAQIRANLERWRWLPHELGSRHVLVNTAGHQLLMVNGGDAPLRMRIISGRASRQSPSFAAPITRLVLHPPWTVPTSIAVRDLLPAQFADPDYFTTNEYDVLRWEGGALRRVDPATVDWQHYGEGHFPFTLRQRPGPQNALGRIKFDMPNRYSIYLHDTPARALFRHPIRDFSSGCIRVERPLELASALLGDVNGERAGLVAELTDPSTHMLALPEPVPVYLAYLTVWTDAQGATHFRPDLYRRNGLLLKAFGGSD